ncbi:MAG: site-specific DNA-methyltransferase [Candidatus Lokiarchaeota archaeon]|nr:site-specific DNA-methyltransferase [Candidatus Lokiarchaeota archaeon]
MLLPRSTKRHEVNGLARNGTRNGSHRDMARLEWNRKGDDDSKPDATPPRLLAWFDDGKKIDPPGVLAGENVRNRLMQGDNLHAMRHLLATGYRERVDLIYIDPPFWSGDDYYTKDGQDLLAYKDSWNGSIDSYLDMIHPRLQLMHQLLSPMGSIFVHVDWHAGHYIKLILDEIFGRENLRNEIIWWFGGPSPVKTSFPRKHDVLFFYSKSGEYHFTPQYAPMKQYLYERARKDPDGRLWVDQNVGKITQRKFDELAADGRVFKTNTGRYRRKQFLDEMQGDMIDDVWTIPIINSQANERLGYPTQKPRALLDRVVACASRPGDLVADFFCGSGTTLVAATLSGRHWIGTDSSSVAIGTARDRLASTRGCSFRLESF